MTGSFDTKLIVFFIKECLNKNSRNYFNGWYKYNIGILCYTQIDKDFVSNFSNKLTILMFLANDSFNMILALEGIILINKYN